MLIARIWFIWEPEPKTQENKVNIFSNFPLKKSDSEAMELYEGQVRDTQIIVSSLLMHGPVMLLVFSL